MSAESDMHAKHQSAVRSNQHLQELVSLMPISAAAAEGVWQTLVVAYSLGAIDGVQMAMDRFK